MREIGGYMELDQCGGRMLHEEAVWLNCGRNCLAYLIRAKGIRKILLPYFLCSCVRETCQREQVEISYYQIDEKFRPSGLNAGDAWVYLVNYYGQISTQEIEAYRDACGRVIVDNTQAYFDMPVQGVDTLYTCRKFFGVADGAFLYTDARLGKALERDESYQRMAFILGRYERSAPEFYELSVQNNQRFDEEPVKTMSRLTENLLRGIDYGAAKEKRTRNYRYLHQRLGDINRLRLKETEGAFAYPLLLDRGAEIRDKLIRENVYIPVLWPNVRDEMEPGSVEAQYADRILPLPCDQRYGLDEMEAVCGLVEAFYRQ